MEKQEREFKQLFLFACARGLLADVEGFLEKGVSPGVKDKEGRSGAHFAACHGELETLKFLHSKGVDLDSEDKRGRSPIHYAALHDHEAVVVYLSDKGAWVDACDATDCSPLHLAARRGSSATTSRLLKLGAKYHLLNKWELTALGEAVTRGHTKVCTALAAAGAAEPEALLQRVNGGFTLLHLAAGAGAADAVGWLLQKGCKEVVNDVDNEESLSPLHCCLLGGKLSTAVVEKLVNSGADCSTRDGKGRAAAEILQRPQEWPGLQAQLNSLPVGAHSKLAQKLRAKASPSLLGKASSTATSSSSEYTTTRSRAHQDDSLTAAARLQAAASAQDVAAVFQSMNEADRVHRVKLWARLPETDRQSLPVSDDVKSSLAKVADMMKAVNILKAEEALRKDEQFQEDMGTPAVRSIIDAVIKDPSMGQHVRAAAAQACLNKLRQVRGVLNANDQREMYLEGLLKPWTQEDSDRIAGMEAAVDRQIVCTVAGTCGDSGHSSSAGGQSEIAQAEPKSARSEGEGEKPTADAPQSSQHASSVWAEAGRRLLLQLALAAIMAAIFWWRDELPYQRKAAQLAAQMAEGQ